MVFETANDKLNDLQILDKKGFINKRPFSRGSCESTFTHLHINVEHYVIIHKKIKPEF